MPDRERELVIGVRREAGILRRERTALLTTVARHGAELARAEADAARAAARGDRDEARVLRARVTEIEARRRTDVGRLTGLDDRLRELLGRLRDRVDPCDADPEVPLVLLPVRVETRYSDDRTVLRVRVYPDEIHLDGLDRGLTDREIEAGHRYWLDASLESDDTRGDAWVALVEAVGAARAEWTALASTPTNLEAWRTGAQPPTFPEHDARDRSAALARLLPDRFVVVLEQGGQRTTTPGRPITPDLVAGMLADDGSEFVPTNGVFTPPGGEWMVDYDRALAAGMAIEVPLGRPGAAVDRLIVTGVRLTQDPDDIAAEMGDLLTAHRCTRGLAFVLQGTPSNNTEFNDTEWSKRPTPREPRHLLEPATAEGRNADVLAAALGLAPTTLDGLEHADDREQPFARAMNTALWPVTWGTFLDRLATTTRDGGSTISDAMLQDTRSFFIDAVRGRGPLPTIRVGDQPYGILPTASLDAAHWPRRSGDRVETHVLPLLRRIQRWWNAPDDPVPTIMDGGPIEETLLDILGASAVSTGMRVREVVSDDARSAATTINVLNPDAGAWEQLIEAAIIGSLGVDAEDLESIGSLASSSRRLPLARTHASDPEFMRRLLDGETPKAASVLQAMLQLAHDDAEREVASAAPNRRTLRELVGAASELSPARRAAVIAIAGRDDRVPALELIREADAVASEVGEHGRETLRTFTPANAFRTSFHDLAVSSTVTANAGLLATYGTIMWLRAKARLRQLEEAIETLAETSDAERAVLFSEVIDLASHRLDAWTTGVIEQRRRRRRTERPTGITVGCYGWLEHIAPGRGAAPDGGYVHAPSIDHAVTAGVLRSADLTHNGRHDSDGSFAIDLSSARVRSALHLMDGLRQGQPLGALLGYRIERALHEARLDRLILTLRRLAPLVGGRYTARQDTVQPEAQEAVAANNVVDGVSLVEQYRSGTAAQTGIRAALDAPPADNPYIDPDDPDAWPGLDDGDWATVRSIIEDAEDALDATSDLMLAESVHQLVVGNTSRAAAAMDATGGGGDVPPPEPEVIETPVPSATFVHRVVLLAPADGAAGPGAGGGAAAAGWNPLRPRAAAEPRLEAWAASRLGDPARIVVATPNGPAAPVTLADTGLCALDVVFESADRRRLEQRIRAALPDLAIDTPLAERRAGDWSPDRQAFGAIALHAAALRRVLIAGAAVRPSDLARANDEPRRTVTTAALDATRARATTALGGLTGAADDLEAVLFPAGGGTPDAGLLAVAIEAVAAYGVAVPLTEGEDLADFASVTLAEARRRIDVATTALAASPFDQDDVDRAAEGLFGDGFRMLTAIAPPADGDLFSAAHAAGDPAPPPSTIRRFLRDIGSVRQNVDALNRAMLLGDALDAAPELRIVQLSEDVHAWVGGRLDPQQPLPEEPVADLVVLGSPDLDPQAPVVGLVIDQWTDAMPARRPAPAPPAAEGDGAPAADDPDAADADDAAADDADLGDRRATGVAINAASSSARPPQAILLAIRPDDERWTTDRVVDTVVETFERARARGVTLERALAAGRLLPATYQRSSSLQGERFLDFRYVADLADFTTVPAFIKELE